MNNVFQTFCKSVAAYGENPFLHIPASATKAYQEGPIDLTYRETAKQVAELKVVYEQAGYATGHRVALLLENRADFFFHWLALNSLGVSIVPINGEMQEQEIAYLLENSEVCLAISVPEQVEKLSRSSSLANLSLPIVASDNLTSLQAAQTPSQPSEITAQSECALLYTSGSTGKPKGCILSNDYFLQFGLWYQNIGGLCTLESGKERLLTPLPLVHMNAMAVSAMGMMITGGCLIQLDRFHPRIWWQTVRETGATVVHYLGVLPAILLNLEPTDNDDFSGQVKFGFGAGVNVKHHAVFEERFGFPLIESWAMSECGSGGCITANREPRHVGTACFGKKPDNVEVMLLAEDGSEAQPGEPGELLVRAAASDPRKGFFSGYYKNEQATAEVWQGGWLHTGDVVRQSADGSFHFVDRKKNVIRRSGENISALEVEANLVLNPLIDQVAVTAVPDEMRGDEVMACIVLADGVSASEEKALEIFTESMQSLIYYKVPGYIAFVDELPKTASQKPQRGEIKTLGRELMENGECFDLRGSKRKPKESAV